MYMPRYTSPSFAASLRAAFFVLPRPRPRHSPSTIARTIQIGVVFVPSPALSEYTHSMLLHCCCMCWLKSERWPTFPGMRGGGGMDQDEGRIPLLSGVVTPEL